MLGCIERHGNAYNSQAERRSWIHELQSKGDFPMRVQLTPRCVDWAETKVQACWLLSTHDPPPAKPCHSAASAGQIRRHCHAASLGSRSRPEPSPVRTTCPQPRTRRQSDPMSSARAPHASHGATPFCIGHHPARCSAYICQSQSRHRHPRRCTLMCSVAWL